MIEKPIRVLVVEDQDIVRRGLVTILDLDDRVKVVGEASTGVEALRKIPDSAPEVALVDVRMPEMDGVELTRRLTEEHPGVSVLILTTFDDDEYIFGGIRAGARGYLLKNVSSEELVSAIERVSRGESALGGTVASRLLSEIKDSGAYGRPHDPEGILTDREVEISALVGTGATNAEIARSLYISEGTARNQVSKILRKLDLRDRILLALYAAERGWVERRR